MGGGNQTNPHGRAINLQSSKAVAITPNDSTDLATPAHGLYIGVTGDVKVDMQDDGEAVVFKNVLQGTILPVIVTRVYATDTDATNIVALY